MRIRGRADREIDRELAFAAALRPLGRPAPPVGRGHYKVPRILFEFRFIMEFAMQPLLGRIVRCLAAVIVCVSVRAAPHAQGCPPEWLPTFGGQPGIGPSNVFALATFDDGGGSALYAGGDFTSAGGVAANRIAKWNGSEWSALGSGMNDAVHALAVFDDGSGPALYAGGVFSSAGGVAASRIAKWNGTSWSALGSGTNDAVRALTVSGVGGASALFAAGDFTSAGATAANHIARWTAAGWSVLGGGLNDRVNAVTTFDDGSGAALYAGGEFTSVGGHVPANRVAKWNGAAWTAVGSGTNESVRALAVFDDGGGAALYAAGSFTSAGATAANRVAKWSGASWSAVGEGTDGDVAALATFNDGGGTALYASGLFSNAGSGAAKTIAKWSGTSWSSLGTGLSTGFVFGATVTGRALATWNNGSGTALYAAGDFLSAGGASANRIARWNGASWSALGGGGVSDLIDTFATFDDGTRPALYAAGSFLSGGGVAANRVAKWTGAGWSALGNGLHNVDGTGTVKSLAVFDDGSGPALYAGGLFTFSASVLTFHLARWNGTGWTGFGGGVDHGVFVLATYDDGGGPALFVGGNFDSADSLFGGAIPAAHVAKWNGTSWSALGAGTNGTVEAFAEFDDGSGPALYVAGSFSTAGGAPASRIARWKSGAWSAVGGGIDAGPGTGVRALRVHDDGSGPALYAGGIFASAGGVAASNLARWNGASWSAVGGGTSGEVLALSAYDDGSGAALYAGGKFETAGGVNVHGVARWNGASFAPLGAGMLGVAAFAGFDDGTGPALYVGGSFETSPAGDSFLARWGCPSIAGVPGCAGNPAALTALAAGAPLGANLPLQVSAAAAQSGLSIVYFGASGVDASGCGPVLPGFGELLLALAPTPVSVASAALVGGASHPLVPIPANGALLGLTVHLQAVAVDLGLPQPIELSNGLSVKLGP